MASERGVFARAPGRVNLIGDHTDYTGGLVMPMAIERGTTVEGTPGGDAVRLTSADFEGEAIVPLDVGEPRTLEPAWARYVGGVVSVLRPTEGFVGRVSTTLPVGAGLSSSAALEVAVALALGFEGTAAELAVACQRAEQVASGVPCGVMDQLASAAGREGHALVIDCSSLAIEAVALPNEADIVVVHSGQARQLAASAYAARRRECELAETMVGPLRRAGPGDVDSISDPVVKARARHVVTENERVRQFADALARDDLPMCGAVMTASHASLRDDFEVSTPALDALVVQLVSRAGVLGARLTGAGFGGCVVALARPGAVSEGWHLRAGAGARVTSDP